MNLQQLIDDFLLTIKASGDVESEKTVAWNRRRIALFADFVRQNEIAAPLTTRTFRRYVVDLKTRPRLDGRPGTLSAAYRRGCLQVLKRFGRWLYQEGYLDRDPGTLISLPRIPRHDHRKAITPEDQEKMIKHAGSLRVKTLLVVLRDTGCLAEEMIGMCWKDVSLTGDRIWVTGKRKKSRWVFMSPEAVIMLTAYRPTVPHDDDDAVWWAHPGRADMAPLTYYGMYTLFHRIAQEAGIKGRWNPHSWRHAFCQRMNFAGVSTLNLQEFLGHSDPKTTSLYTYSDPEKLQEIYHQATETDE